ncbi:acylneuraminate cytidylyltransferase family protein [Accumulibacter sp.]|uniref:acylneuraminate cytidylyltransferase family protein n=1 Tax=Accumulibacter sp. TaxID=2053492 RepID=UPI0026054F4D|nr:acylneuraminate cytidylyltransferase family protein [Accumulibacter sp.]
MIGNDRFLALIPARAGSKGLPGKNIRPLHGKPLLAWPILAAKASRYVDRVVVSTDSQAFAEIAQAYGADVPALRPAHLAADTSPSSAAVVHMLDTLEARGERFDYLVLLEPTSPLTEASDVDGALEKLVARRDIADALVSVNELISSHPAFAVRQLSDGRLEPYAAVDFTRLPRRQDVDPIYALDGSLYISSVTAYRKTLSFCHDRTLSYVMPHYKSLEVDSLIDFICIEAILKNYEQIRCAA